MSINSDEIRLTQFSHGAGCGCKISPKVLEQMLSKSGSAPSFSNLLVGNDTKDDAAVLDLDGETSIISTTDFFMPIVDDAHDFGAISATNAISDIYAMGGKPQMAIAILGWPIDKLPIELASQVIKGGRDVCSKAGIPLAGGHSIDSPEPIFGLAVTGTVRTSEVKKNSTAREGDLIYLSKPIGIGMVSTAQKKGLAPIEDLTKAKESMLKLNSIGQVLAKKNEVHAITDVTGFGLAGHLLEVCEGSALGACIYADKIPRFDFVARYMELACHPGGTHRNWESYGSKIESQREEDKYIIADPQTSGGLLIAVDKDAQESFEKDLKREGLDLSPIGTFTKGSPRLTVL